MTNRQRVVVAMIDGLDPAYATPEVMPELDRLGANGLSTVVEAIAPTVTNANNAGISCAAWPSEHGITGNYYYVPATGEEDYMESAELLLRPTLMTQVADHGGKAALLTAKKKTVSLLGTKTTLAVAAEEPPAAFADRYGQPPGIYSAGINHWLWTVAVDLLRTQPDLDLLYVHTTDFPMHSWAPGADESNDHLAKLDALIGEAVDAAPDAAFFATADHGMNYKTLVYDLNQALANRDAPVRRALSAEKDKYVRHHRTFGGAAWIWLNDPRDEGRVTDALNKLPGVESVLTRGDAAVRFHLHPDRIGDLVVLGDPNTVFGDLAPGQESEQLPSHYRSHGSLHEVPVPLVAHNNESLQYRTPPKHNKDLLTPLLTNWLPGTHHP
ncbi:alkaline phosphatase family protein [Kribbella solani]|uniref:alkaline phosphatase family protein n=1 Tax=Kribbella solani TaxID=236067 RepID=UPI0029BBB9E4|nr:alkaline phosphatase family protein [Kribbella solani]MDX3004865.1 alkaline phosphatase family protein [Kribbella solani]